MFKCFHSVISACNVIIYTKVRVTISTTGGDYREYDVMKTNDALVDMIKTVKYDLLPL